MLNISATSLKIAKKNETKQINVGFLSNLRVLEKKLLNLSRKIDEPKVINDNLEFMKDLARRDVATILIKEILTNEALLDEVAARSYEHVNYFDKIVLINNNDPQGYRLTLHSWNRVFEKDMIEEELVHNHRFSFWSNIYRGTLVSENFEESSEFSIEKKTFNKFIYSPSNTGNIHTCKFDKKVQLNKLCKTSLTQGETYYLNFITTHRVILPLGGENLCTFVLRGPRQREYTNTYNTFYPEEGIKSDVPMMTAKQLRRKLVRILGGYV